MHTAPNAIRTGFIETDDNIQIHWKAIGNGQPIVCCNGVGVSTFFWKYICDQFQDRFQILLWDYRGHGLSQRDIDVTTDLSIERHTKDLELVIKAASSDSNPAILIGHSMGCQVILEFYRRNPKQTAAIVMMLGTAGRALETFANNSNSAYVFSKLKGLANRIGPRINRVTQPLLICPLAWPFATKLELVDPLYTRKKDFWPYLEHLSTMNLLLFLESAWQCHLHDAWPILPDISVPFLYIAAEKDGFTPLDCAKKIVSKVPGGEMLILADGSHAAIIEQPETINYRLDRFFAEKLVAQALHQ